jgi:hypothetical protein
MKRSNHLVRRTFEGHQHYLINRITFRYKKTEIISIKLWLVGLGNGA